MKHIQVGIMVQVVFLTTYLVASDNSVDLSGLQPRTSRNQIAYFIDDRSPAEHFLLAKMQEKAASRSQKFLEPVKECVEEQAYSWAGDDREVSVFVTDGRSDCQSPWCSLRSDSTDTLINGQKRSGAKNPSPELRLEDCDLNDWNAKDAKK